MSNSPVKKYDWLLFDADETLFHFDNFKGLQLMFKRHGVTFDEADFQEYQQVNKPLWVDYELGNINADQVKTIRFEPWAKKLNLSPSQLNSDFIEAMSEISTPLEGALDLMVLLEKAQIKVAIVTNGFTDLQAIRLTRTGMDKYVQAIIISEEVGFAKPHQEIFDYAFEKIGQPDKSRVLMVGDNLSSDILGGQNYGIDTCWLNRHEMPSKEGITPTFTIENLMQLETIIY